MMLHGKWTGLRTDGLMCVWSKACMLEQRNASTSWMAHVVTCRSSQDLTNTGPLQQLCKLQMELLRPIKAASMSICVTM